MSIEVEQTTIGGKLGEHGLLSGDRQYRIPDFQRPYVWESEQVETLMADLLEAWHREGEEDYFLGSIVVVSSPGSIDEDIIDGQQRLTTICLLLAVIRYLILDETQRGEITELLKIPRRLIRGLEERPRLKMRNRDVDFFEDYIIDGDLDSLRDCDPTALATKGQRNMHANTLVILDALEDVINEDNLWSFLQFLSERVSIVKVKTDTYQSAHRIFGVLNTRGVSLTAADIFKARVLAAVSSSSRDSYGDLWDRTLDEASPDSADQFFSHLLVLYTHDFASRALIDEFEAKVLAPYLREHTGKEFIDDLLVPTARAYREIASATEATMPGGVWLELLRQYPASDWKPAAMSVLRLDVPQEGKADLLKRLERMYGANYMAKVSPGKREKRLVRAMRALDDDVRPVEHADRIFSVGDDVRLRVVARLKSSLTKKADGKILLYRALMALDGRIPTLPRATTAIQALPPAPIDGIDPKTPLEAWSMRLGGLALSAMKPRDVRTAGNWSAINDKLRSTRGIGKTVVASFPGADTLDDRALQERHGRLVELVADYWDIRRDSDHVDLTRMTEEELGRNMEGKSGGRTKLVRLADVVDSGIIAPGDVFVWRRPNIGDEYSVTVTDSGRLELSDGTSVASPSAAVRALTGTSAAAFDVFVRESDGKKMRELWDTYRRRFSK